MSNQEPSTNPAVTDETNPAVTDEAEVEGFQQSGSLTLGGVGIGKGQGGSPFGAGTGGSKMTSN